MNDIGHNFPPRAQLERKIEDLACRAERLPADITTENAPLFRDVMAAGTALAKDVERTRKDEKQPHLDEAAAVDNEFRPLGENIAKIVDQVRRRLTDWATAEEKRRVEEARQAELRRQQAEDEARKAAEAAADGDPFAETDRTETEHVAALAGLDADRATKRAAAAPSVSSTQGYRAGSLRTTRKAKITDAKALVAHFSDHPSLVAEAEKLANGQIRAARGGPVTIPGIEVVEERSFA